MEIANAYGVKWAPEGAEGDVAIPFDREEGGKQAESGEGENKGEKEVSTSAPADYPAGEESTAWNDKAATEEPKAPALSPEAALAARFEALKRK